MPKCCWGKKKKLCAENTNSFAERITLTASLISALPSECREWRTVLVPTLVDESDIRAIAAILPKDASWQFTQFRNENCLDVRYNDIAPYTDEEASRLVSVAKSLIHGAEMR